MRPLEDEISRRLADGQQGPRLLTFRGPLLPSRRRAAKVPDSLVHYAGFAAIVAAHDIEGRYERALEPVGISVRDFVVLAEIGRSPGIGQLALAERVGLGRSRLSDHLSTLETNALTERLLNVADLRRRRVWLTSYGQSALADGRRRIERADRNWLMALAIQEKIAFRTFLDRLEPATRAPRLGYPPAT